MTRLRDREKLKGDIRPLVVNVMNFSKASDGEPTLLSFDDAKTLSTNSVTLCTDFAAALKIAKPIQFKENIALVLKYFDQLVPFMQEQDSSLRPAD